MTDAEIDTIMEKACSTPQGELKASFILNDLAKIAPVYSDPATRPQAEAVLAAWHESPDPLRKGMSLAWVARAKNALAGAGQAVARASGAQAVAGAARRGYAQAEGKAGDLGAAAGAKLARSRLGAKGMAASAEKGGLKAQNRVAAAGAASGSNVHADALASAFRSGAEHASQLHASAAARHGRVAARHAFKAGLALAGAGAATAAAGTASRAMNGNGGAAAQKPPKSGSSGSYDNSYMRPGYNNPEAAARTNARLAATTPTDQSKAPGSDWDKRLKGTVAKAAETDELEKGFGSTVGAGARAAVGFVRRNAREAALTIGVGAAASALSPDDTPKPPPHVAKLKALNTKPPQV